MTPLTDIHGVIAGDQPGMSLQQALDVADISTPAPALAHRALKVFKSLHELLAQIRDHAGVDCPFGDLPEAVAALRRAAQRQAHAGVINMVLHCPSCGTQHVDAPDRSTDWDNPPHRSHLCHQCGLVWRPADVWTTGVQEVETRGSCDTWPVIASDGHV